MPKVYKLPNIHIRILVFLPIYLLIILLLLIHTQQHS